MRIISIIAGVAAFSVRLCGFVVAYRVGYNEVRQQPILIGIIIEVLFLVAFGVLLAMFAISLKMNSINRTSIVCGTVLMLISCSCCMLPTPARVTLYGLQSRVLKEYSVTGLRRFADEASLLHPFASSGQNLLFKVDWQGTDIEKYSFMNRGGGPSFISIDAGCVKVVWGGGLSGHWGFTVGRENEPPPVDVVAEGSIEYLSEDHNGLVFFYNSE